MLYSSDRMSCIIEYISAYEQKISLANQHGLFDNAKMFELFAKEICCLWFNRSFKNLNDTAANYPYVDLISSDEKLFVQVSTAADISAKIQKTLHKIRDSKKEKAKKIETVIFFVLDNKSLENVTDYVGDKQIGAIPFTVKDNLITTKDIITKAESDNDFQQKLYEVLKNEFESFQTNVKNFEEALDFSRNVGLSKIDDLINNEYEIDRQALLTKIKEEDKRFISIQGRAGCGKSVVCKKYVQDEDLVLYARAEKFAEANHLEDIWNISVKELLEYLNGKKIIFFIDALEFISDCMSTKIDLLQYLYELAKKHQNVYIITSCRTSDKNAFIKLESLFEIAVYEVEDITPEELLPIAQKYPIINKMLLMNSYAALLKSPFYINLIVSKEIDIEKINDENSLREYIWENIICLRSTAKLYKLNRSDIANTIEKIVFERAKKFLPGINKDEINSKILQTLLSEDVIVQQGQNIRLKYDIFEDICFEHYFDIAFENCKGNYSAFYKEIEGLGRCIYRRYQIWISNKLFIKTTQKNFICKLIFSSEIPEEWKRQTIIGIVKSRYCDEFFKEFGNELYKNGLLPEMINLTNIYAYEIKKFLQKDILPFPVGNGRPCLIRIIAENEYYKDSVFERSSITKLCSSYIASGSANNEIFAAICQIMQYYIAAFFENSQKDYYYLLNEISPFLGVLYQIAGPSAPWLDTFFAEVENDYKDVNRDKNRFAENVIEWTLDHTTPELVKCFGDKLCHLADILYLQENQPKRNNFEFYDSDSIEYAYGLSEKAKHYEHSHRSVNNSFLVNLFFYNYKTGLEWAVNLINKTIEHLQKSNPEELENLQIKFVEKDIEKEYLAYLNMWLSGIKEYSVPILIGDIAYWLRIATISILKNIKSDVVLFKKFAQYIKNLIYEKTNNIILLTVIEYIGFHFAKELPGYALDLVSNIELVHFDFSRYSLYQQNSIGDMLKKQICLGAGVPFLSKRYELDKECNNNLEIYTLNAQFSSDTEVRNKCYKIIDYLYTITKNEETEALYYLLLQKMDGRTASVEKLPDGGLKIIPTITGEAKKLTERQQELSESQEKVYQVLKNISTDKSFVDIPSTTKAIEDILKITQNAPQNIQYEPLIISLIECCLKSEELPGEKRNNYCEFLITGINKWFSNGSFLGEASLLPILLEQGTKEIDVGIKNKIKKLILDFVLYSGSNGIITNAQPTISDYLSNHLHLAECVFNTIVMLAESKKTHFKYNEKNDKGEEEEIINVYLYQENSLTEKAFELDNYDIQTLFCICNCGMPFKSDIFRFAICKLLCLLIDLHQIKSGHDIHKIVSFYHEFNLRQLFSKMMLACETEYIQTLDVLFNNIDFSLFSQDMIDFYLDIFKPFTYEYFDSYIDNNRRNICQRKIEFLEDRINNIENESVRKELYKSLMLSTSNTMSKWNECSTSFSYLDKHFLNKLFSNYGKYYPDELLNTIYNFNAEKLLPEILLSISRCFSFEEKQEYDFSTLIKNQDFQIRKIITRAYVLFGQHIKQNQELIDAFENILRILIENNYELAAIILDEFRTH